MSLLAAINLHSTGELILIGGRTVQVRATSTKLTKFSFAEGAIDAEVELSEPRSSLSSASIPVDLLPSSDSPSSDSYVASLPVHASVIESVLGCPPMHVVAQLQSEDKAVRKQGKAASKATNTFFHGLHGLFELGSGDGGRLTVMRLPQPGGAP